MISAKKFLYEIVGHTKYRVVNVENTTTTTIAANGTEWVVVPKPSSGTPISIVGWYVNGTTGVFPYSVNLTSSGAQFALRNTANASATFTLNARYLVVD